MGTSDACGATPLYHSPSTATDVLYGITQSSTLHPPLDDGCSNQSGAEIVFVSDGALEVRPQLRDEESKQGQQADTDSVAYVDKLTSPPGVVAPPAKEGRSNKI